MNVYLEQCRVHSEVMPRPADLQWVLALGEAFWSHFFAVVTAKRKEVVWPADSSSDFPMDFLRVSALLPPRLRLALRWSFELPAVPKNAVRIRLGSGSELGSVEKTSCEGTYWQWLKACVGRLEPELVYEVAESWEINSWERLEGAILEMAKQRTTSKPIVPEPLPTVRPVAGPPPAGLHDLRAIEESVKRYLDRRLEGFEPERERRAEGGISAGGPKSGVCRCWSGSLS
ncbi:MAG: hypothetical protein HC897_14995 [Thermoanaerobaculia bacterium]|nr:hypothetical protein [Thermoanaerobaculia bacterium]